MTEVCAWLRLTVAAEAPVLEAVASLLVEWGAGGGVDGEGELAAYFSPQEREEVEAGLRRYRADLGEALAWTWREEVGDDWADGWRAHFRPSRVSPRLAVCPSWEEWTPGDPDVRVIRIDPGRAFGTGTHETTRLCLELLDLALADAPGTPFLDVGCGSGILSVAALLLGAPLAVAVDVDRLAPACSRENAQRNGVGDRLWPIWGDLRCLASRARYPLVAANILYQGLLGLAPALSRRVAPGGRLILSGMLVPELPSAAALYTGAGFREARRETRGEWGALELRRTQDRSV